MDLSTRRRFLGRAGAILLAPAVARSGFAQSWPSKPIHVIVPFVAGGTVDVIARIAFEQLSKRLGQNIIVDNRGGAGGTIGSAIVARAKPDGYNLLVNSSAHTNAPAAFPTITYDPARDFNAVVSFGSIPNVIAAAPSKGFRTLKDLVEAGKKRQLSFASAGIGSAMHWAVERLQLSAGFKALHVPFKAGPEAVLATMTGSVDFIAASMEGALVRMREGSLVGLAVSTAQRSRSAPDIPTTLEAGYPDSDYTFWNGMFAPSKTPREIIDRLYREMTEVLRHPAVVEKYTTMSIDPMPMTPQEFDARVVREIAVSLDIVKKAGLKFN